MRKLFRILGASSFVIVLVASLVWLQFYWIDIVAHDLKEGREVSAFEKIKPLAMLGDPLAQNILADMYAFGNGVTQNDDEAIRWFRRAAWFARLSGIKANDGEDAAVPAELAVAAYYAAGTGVRPNPEKRQKWLSYAASGGSKDAERMLKEIK